MEHNSLGGDPGNPLTRTFQDDVIVEVQHVNAPFVMVRANTLTIERRNEADHKWFISSEEVERLAHLQGLTLSLKDRLALAYYHSPTSVTLGVVVIIVAPLLTLLVLRARRKRKLTADTQSDA